MIKKVSIFLLNLFNFYLIEEYFEILFKQKNYYYLKNNHNKPFVIEESKIDEIIQRYDLNNIYFGLDKKNIFKRIDRYRNKKRLLAIFVILIVGNLHEIIFNLIHFIYKIDPDEPDKNGKNYFYLWNLISEFYCDIYIGTLLFLSGLTFAKLKIETKIYY